MPWIGLQSHISQSLLFSSPTDRRFVCSRRRSADTQSRGRQGEGQTQCSTIFSCDVRSTHRPLILLCVRCSVAALAAAAVQISAEQHTTPPPPSPSVASRRVVAASRAAAVHPPVPVSLVSMRGAHWHRSEPSMLPLLAVMTDRIALHRRPSAAHRAPPPTSHSEGHPSNAGFIRGRRREYAATAATPGEIRRGRHRGHWRRSAPRCSTAHRSGAPRGVRRQRFASYCVYAFWMNRQWERRCLFIRVLLLCPPLRWAAASPPAVRMLPRGSHNGPEMRRHRSSRTQPIPCTPSAWGSHRHFQCRRVFRVVRFVCAPVAAVPLRQLATTGTAQGSIRENRRHDANEFPALQCLTATRCEPGENAPSFLSGALGAGGEPARGPSAA